MRELSHLENEIYRYISESIEADGFAPSVRDICAALGIKSTSTAHAYIDKLVDKGLVVKKNGKSRAISIEHYTADKKDRTLRVPILGRVPAGQPLLAVENYDGYIDFPLSMTHGESGVFALRVVGTSMIEAGILDGDIVVVQSCSYADNGQIVVALINDEATVKRFYREDSGFRLQPENSNMDPIYVKELTLLGKVIANFRFY